MWSSDWSKDYHECHHAEERGDGDCGWVVGHGVANGFTLH